MKVYEIYFSPTGGTKKVVDMLAKELSSEICEIDLTDGTVDFSTISITENDIALIAVPSYAGRVPVPAVERLAKIKANAAKAILVCVYGNRAYEDTLIELNHTAKQAGFRVISAVAAIAEHSIARQFAAGRPDTKDHAKLCEFAEKIQIKLAMDDDSEPVLPGNHPYKQVNKAGMIPKPTQDCVKCGLCAKKCPVQAIDKNSPENVDESLCVSCMRCVCICPHSARSLDSKMLSAVSAMLQKVCADRKECELYI